MSRCSYASCHMQCQRPLLERSCNGSAAANLMDAMMAQAMGTAKHSRRNIAHCTLSVCADMALSLVDALGIEAAVPEWCQILASGGNDSTVAAPSRASTPVAPSATERPHVVPTGSHGANDTAKEPAVQAARGEWASGASAVAATAAPVALMLVVACMRRR